MLFVYKKFLTDNFFLLYYSVRFTFHQFDELFEFEENHRKYR